MAVLVAITGFFTGKAVVRGERTEKDLAEHKLHVSENYVKNSVLSEIKMEQINSSNRLHERIDDADKKLDGIKDKVEGIKDKMHDGFSELKTLIASK